MNAQQQANPQTPNQQPPIQITVEESMKAGVYSNAASASVTVNELVLDFGYIVPNERPAQVKIVSRVNMTVKTAESLLQLLQGSVNDYYTKVLPKVQAIQQQAATAQAQAPMQYAQPMPKLPNEGAM